MKRLCQKSQYTVQSSTGIQYTVFLKQTKHSIDTVYVLYVTTTISKQTVHLQYTVVRITVYNNKYINKSANSHSSNTVFTVYCIYMAGCQFKIFFPTVFEEEACR